MSKRDYCKKTNAGNYEHIRKKIQNLEDGESVKVKKRLYKKVGENLIVNDL